MGNLNLRSIFPHPPFSRLIPGSHSAHLFFIAITRRRAFAFRPRSSDLLTFIGRFSCLLKFSQRVAATSLRQVSQAVLFSRVPHPLPSSPAPYGRRREKGPLVG